MNIDFKGKTVLITGAGGFLGRTLVKEYVSSGVERLVLLDRKEKEEDLQNIYSMYCDQVNIKIYIINICNLEEIDSLVEYLLKKEIKIDVLVNNAGINILRKAIEMDEVSWDYVVNTNLKGSFFLTKMIAKSSLIEREGNIVFVSSQHSVVGNDSRTAYCSSKTAILGLMRALVAEWSKFGVRINAVSPTFILNENNESYLNDSIGKRNMLNKIPLHRYATVENVAAAIIFITCDRASMVNGHNFIIDGGYTVL